MQWLKDNRHRVELMVREHSRWWIPKRLDHRIAMSFAIGALGADGETRIEGADCVKISYPEFYQTLEKLIQ